MRAAQYDAYGKPDVLHEATTPRPVPGRGQVLVRVHGTSVNVIELAVRRGALRIATGFRFPKGMGLDFAGEIESLGEEVTSVAVGDRVWGFLPGLPGSPSAAAAEYLVTKPGRLSIAPTSIDLVDAAALPMAAATALTALRDHAHLKAGDRLLIRGASGGVGSAAVQLGVAMGAQVTALAGAGNLAFVRGLGADAALDYHTHGPDQLGRFEVILDLTGSRMGAYRRLLARHGRMVTTAANAIPYILFSTIHGSKRVRAFSTTPKAQLLADVAGYVDRGELAPVIDAVRPLAELAAAHAALEAGGGRGKHVVRVIE
ncbi:MAG: alcohol dehydrogenase GroES domain protein [Rhodoglobus sp.]|nr:alcohol dehydrogenase GroES domain protein [Rhodoglobus sp.]